MADWTELHRLAVTGAVARVQVQEINLATVEDYLPDGGYKDTLGIKSVVRLIDGTVLHVTETYEQLMAVLKTKVKV